MELIEISHLYKTFKTGKHNNEVLKDVSLLLPDNGLVIILGKSGCGKSTLLNLIGGLDKPSKGKIIYKKAYSPPRNRLIGIKRQSISFIFQHYNLLENEILFYNVILPGLIQGMDRKELEEQAIDLLNRMGFQNDVFEKKVELLSGGEKARIALLRVLITNPSVVLADEPTGALDEENSLKTFDMLKKASKRRLVVVVTHNEKLAEKYADRIIKLYDGHIVSDTSINRIEPLPFEVKSIKRKENEWIDHFVFNNFKKRFKRNMVSILGMTISMCFSYFLIGFTTNSKIAINDVAKKHFDYGSGTISKEIKNSSSDSKISLIKTVRPTFEELNDIETKFPSFTIMNNYDCYLNSGGIYVEKENISGLFTGYVFDFSSFSVDKNLIIETRNNYTKKWTNIYINQKANELLKELKISNLEYKMFYESSMQFKGETVIDILDIHEKLNIIGVVDEFDFLSVPKIYFDYSAIDLMFSESILENASYYSESNLTWKSLVDNAEINSELSSYSYRIFLNDINNSEEIKKLTAYLCNDIAYENNSLEVAEALDSLTYAATIGLNVFLIICLAGSAMILGVFSFSSYNDDKKKSSILTCLGAKNYEVILIFVSETFICSLFAFALSTVLSILLVSPVNSIVMFFTSIPNLLNIPMGRFLGKKFLLPILFFIGVTFLGTLFTVTPILISKRLSVTKELAEL